MEANYATLLGKQMYKDIIAYAQPQMIYDKMSVTLSVDKNVFEYIKMNQLDNMGFDDIGPGADMDNDVLETTKLVSVLDEKGKAPEIPLRVIEDQDFQVVDLVSKSLARSYARGLNEDFITAMNADISTNSAAAAATWDDAAGDPYGDFTRAVARVEDDNYIGSTALLHPTAKTYLINDPNFMIASDKAKTQVEDQNARATARVYGSDLFISSDQTSTVLSVVDKDNFAWHLQRSPLIIEPVPGLPSRRSVVIRAHTRYKFQVIQEVAGSKTTSIL